MVRFYEDDAFLIESLADFLSEELRHSDCGLVIATPDHVKALRTRLEAVGLNVAALEQGGRFIALDAEQTLARFSIDGCPNENLFEEIVGSLVAKITANGQRLRAFGEMVALLFAAGKASEAIRLEGFWNRLRLRHEFELLCAYPLRMFASSGAGREFIEICRTHARVLPTETFSQRSSLDDDELRQIALLQQRAAALEAEILEREKAETRLRQRQSELTAFVETASIGLHWVSADGIIKWANLAELKLLGYEWNEYVGHHLSEFHADQAVIDDIWARLCRGETLRDFEARLRCKSGEIKMVLIDSTGLWDDGRFVHTQCFTRDVTEQRRAEQAIRHMAAIVDGSDDAILSKNLDGIVTSWNSGAERIFGYRKDEMAGQSITLLIPPDRLHEEQMILSRLRRGERIDHYETVRRRKDGALLDISLTISPIKDRRGVIVGASKIARDVTQNKAAQKALEAMGRELEARVRERTASLTDLLSQMESFSYTVSHDLRAPLRSISGFAEALRDENVSEQGRDFIARILRATSRMDRLINDVLAYARVNRDAFELGPVSVSDCIHQVVQHAPELQPPSAQIHVQGGIPEVLGTETFLTQIFANLLGNAVKFVAPGCIPEVEISWHRRGNLVRIEVADNGVGIPPQSQSRLFGLFERLNADKRYDGTGIGLAIVRRAVERMGGSIGVESDGHSGTCFWISLQAAHCDTNGAPPRIEVNGYSSSPKPAE